MLLFSLVLIYLSRLALGTLISCLLSSQLIVCVTLTLSFLPLILANGCEQHSDSALRRARAVSVWPDMPVPHLQGAPEPAYHATASVASGLPIL